MAEEEFKTEESSVKPKDETESISTENQEQTEANVLSLEEKEIILEALLELYFTEEAIEETIEENKTEESKNTEERKEDKWTNEKLEEELRQIHEQIASLTQKLSAQEGMKKKQSHLKRFLT